MARSRQGNAREVRITAQLRASEVEALDVLVARLRVESASRVTRSSVLRDAFLSLLSENPG